MRIMRMVKHLGSAALLASLISSAALPALAADNLTVFDWAGYEDPAFHPAYTAKYGTEPDFSFFGDEEEAFQKLRSGFTVSVR